MASNPVITANRKSNGSHRSNTPVQGSISL
jgi:hypothetical protein